MRISTYTSHSLGNLPIWLNKRSNKASKTHVYMNRYISLSAVGCDCIQRITCTIGIVWIGCIHTNCLIIDCALHFSYVHSIFRITGNNSQLDVEIKTSLNGCNVSCRADNHVRSVDSFFFHFVLTITVNGHQDRLSTPRVECSTRMPCLVFES